MDRPKAIVCDIDDTLDIFGGEPNRRVISFVRRHYALGWHIIILSARNALRQPATMRWLTYWRIPFHELLMAPLGNTLPGPKYKEKTYREKIEPFWNVELSIDNLREPWVSLGVNLWHVQEGSDNRRIAAKFKAAR